MARRPTKPPPTPEPPVLSVAEKRSAIERFQARIRDLEAYDVANMQEERPADLGSLSTSIQRALEKAFGSKTNDYHRFCSAEDLFYHSMIMISEWPGNRGPSLREHQTETAKNIQKSITVLRGAIAAVEEDIADHTALTGPVVRQERSAEPSNEIFVVHGHDKAAMEGVARLLERLGLRAVILHEKPNEGRTLIEKFETHSEVGFAVVLLTPDDVGGPVGGGSQHRARQNVILELGYFCGKLGRQRVCALKKGEVEVPSDFVGVVYEAIDDAGAWKFKLAQELKQAGYPIDMNKVN